MKELRQIKSLQLSPQLMEKLYEHGIKKELKPGDVILNEDAYIRSIPMVMKGTLKVFRTEENGREILLYYLHQGDSCIMSFLAGIHHETSKVRVEAEDDAEILMIPIEKVSYFTKEFPQWVDYIFKIYHQRFEELLDVINAIAFKKIDERLLDLLIQKSKLNQSKIITITHEQLANELGTVRVVVSRLLKRLEEDGSVQLGRNRIQLLI